MEEENKRLLIDKLKIKQDITNADEANGLKIENQDAELRDVKIDMKTKDVKKVIGASFIQTNKPALTTGLVFCECGKRFNYAFTGTPPNEVKCPNCGKVCPIHH